MRSWPKGLTDLLIQAALSPNSQAQEAWFAWKRAKRFEDITSQEIRLLGAVYTRLPDLDPKTPLRPRIDGILKNRWILTQLKLHESGEAFDCLNSNGIPFLILKGGAFLAEGFDAINRRVLGDVDMLVRLDDGVSALEAIHRQGWMAANGESFEYVRHLSSIRLNGNFRKGHYGNIDLHISPFHYSRRDQALDSDLWARARPASLASRSVLVPDPTNEVLIVLAHAPESTNGDWAVDVATRIREQTIDWERLVETADARGIVPASLAGLSYLSRRVGVHIPEHVLSRLSASKVPFFERLKYRSNVRDRSDRSPVERISNRLADVMLGREGFSVVVKDRSAITVTRSTPFPRHFFKRSRPSLVQPSKPCTDYHAELHGLAGCSHLVVEMKLSDPIRSRRLFFDVSIDSLAVARLRTRAGGSDRTQTVFRRFKFRLPKDYTQPVSFHVSARPSHFLRPGATAAEIADFGPFPFQISGVWAY